MDIKLEHYRVFYYVAKNQSFSKAATELFMTQSAVSQSIKNLELTLGCTLFLRSSKGVELTSEGHVLYEYAANALSLLDTANSQLQKLKQLEMGELRIGVGDTISRYYLLPVLERFHRLYPKIKLRIINRVSRDTLSLLKAGKIDLAFVNLPIFDDSADIRAAMSIQDIFVAGSKFLYLKAQELSAQQVAALPLILLEEKSNSRNCMDEFFRSKGVTIIPEIELGSHDLLLDFAQSNLGISCVIREFSQQYLDSGRIFELKLKEALPPRNIGICTLKGVRIGPPAEKLLSLIEI